MATVQTIATTLTNDHRPAVTSLRVFEGEVDKTFTRLDARTKRFNTSSAEAMLGGGRGRGGRGDFAGGFLELSRGIEDASVGFQLNGLQGAVRGAGNNLSQLALIMGGPVTGAIAGLTVAALPSLVNWLTSGKNAARDFGKEIEFAMQQLEKSQKVVEQQVGFRQMVGGLGDSKTAGSELQKRINEIETINNKINDIEGRRARSGNQFKLQNPQLFDPAEVAAADEAERRMFAEGLALMRDRKVLEEEINKLREKRNKLQEQELANDAQKLIRGFQEDDAKEIQRQKDKARDEVLRDNERIQEMLGQGAVGLGAKRDPLAGLWVPDAMRPQLEGLFGELDNASKKPGGLAGVGTAGDQSLLRAQYQVKEAAMQERRHQALIQRIDQAITALKAIQKANEPVDALEVDVNLN